MISKKLGSNASSVALSSANAANYFEKIRNYLLELDCTIVREDGEQGVLVIEHEDEGIKNLVIGCADPILIMEQFLFEIKQGSEEVFKNLLQKNIFKGKKGIS